VGFSPPIKVRDILEGGASPTLRAIRNTSSFAASDFFFFFAPWASFYFSVVLPVINEA